MAKRTNRYRQSHRVLEVNLDMANHLLTTLRNFAEAGLDEYQPSGSLIAPETWNSLEIPFKLGKGATAKTVVLRRGQTLVMLPLIGLGALYKNAAYQPYPAICGVIEGAPEAQMPFLVPEYIMPDGRRLRPIQYYNDVKVTQTKDGATVEASGSLCDMGDKLPVATEYTFNAIFEFKGDTVSAFFETDADASSVQTVIGSHGSTAVFAPYGFDESEAMPTEGVYDFMTPHGAVTSAALYTKHGCGKVGYICLLK